MVYTYKIIVRVKEVRGTCTAGLKVGDRMTIRCPGVDLKETDGICINALSALMPFLRQHSLDPLPSNARFRTVCPDPGPEKGGRGSVLFEISREKIGRDDTA